MNVLSRISKNNFSVFFVIFLFSLFGLVMVFSSSSLISQDSYGNPWYYFNKQLIFLIISISAFFIVQLINLNWLIKNSSYLLIINFILLLLVFNTNLNHTVGIAQRWIKIGSLTFQPVESLKIFLALYFTKKLLEFDEERIFEVTHFKKVLFPVMLICFISIVLLLLQPDFGNAFIVLSLLFFSLYIVGVKLKYLFYSIIVSLPLLIVTIFGQDYRRKRILAFLNPWENANDSGYQIVQSFLAFFTGGFWGSGIGNSIEKRFFLPEAHTDFIFSVIGEEIGFFGAGLIVCFYLFIMYKLILLIINNESLKNKILSSTLLFVIIWQAILNLFVVTGMLPTKGLPLPLVSYGGSSLLCTFIMLGLIFSSLKNNQYE